MNTKLKLYLFGAVRFTSNGQKIHITRRKSVAFLIYLALTQRSQHRDKLGAMFWPESADSRNQVRVALSTLRTALGADWFSDHGDFIEIANTDQLWVDVLEFKALTECLNVSPSPKQIGQLESAIALVRGNFLEGFTLRDCPAFDEWFQYEELALHRTIETALTRLVELHDEQNNHVQAINYAEQLIAHDPLNETSYRRLMQLHYDRERYHDVRKIYALCATNLQEQLGVEPGSQTQAILRRVAQHQTLAPEDHNLNAAEPPPYFRHVFFGREDEIKQMFDLLTIGHRLISLIGIGGVGKTHLASKITELAPKQINLQTVFISLEGAEDTEQALLLIASKIHLRLQSGLSSLNQLITYLKHKPLLLILDNAEQLIPAFNAAVTQLLQHTEKLKILVTSRILLRLHEEYPIRVTGLNYPHDPHAIAIEHLDSYESIRFFSYWAQKRNAQFQVSEDNIKTIGKLCKVVEGVPLALRLAAMLTEVLDVTELLQEIQNSLHILQSNLTNIPEKHYSIYALFENIWLQIPADEQQAFMKLAIFPGGFTYHAAAHITGITPLQLKSLLDQSLLVAETGSEHRYHIHELLRIFALEKNAGQSLTINTSAHFVHYYVNYVSLREIDLRGGNQLQALQDVDRELINIRHAWHLALDQLAIDEMHTLLTALTLYLRIRGYWNEGYALFEHARQRLTSHVQTDQEMQHLMNRLTARFYQASDDYIVLFLELILAAQNMGAKEEVAYLTAEVAWQCQFLGHHRLSLRYFAIALTKHQRLADIYNTAAVLHGMAISKALQNQLDEAVDYSYQSIVLREQTRDLFGLSLSNILQGELHLLQADFETADRFMMAAYAYIEDNISPDLAIKQLKLLPLCKLCLGELELAATMADQLTAITDTSHPSGEYLLGFTAITLTNALHRNPDVAYMPTQKIKFMVADPNLQTGQGKFSDSLRILVHSIRVLIYALNGDLDDSKELAQHLKANVSILQIPLAVYFLFTADVIILLHELGATLNPDLRGWLYAQPWLNIYLHHYRSHH